jgi:hypothetical protein
VDIGGGVGTSSLQIARAFPKVKTIVQDFPQVIAQAKDVRYNYFHPLSTDTDQVRVLQALEQGIPRGCEFRTG